VRAQPGREHLRRVPRVEALGTDSWRLGAELWGHQSEGTLDAVCHAGANLVLVEAGPEAVHAFAERARRQGRRCSSIVGLREPTALLWSLLEPTWGPAARCAATSR
jgi:hypothetical protein